MVGVGGFARRAIFRRMRPSSVRLAWSAASASACSTAAAPCAQLYGSICNLDIFSSYHPLSLINSSRRKAGRGRRCTAMPKPARSCTTFFTVPPAEAMPFSPLHHLRKKFFYFFLIFFLRNPHNGRMFIYRPAFTRKKGKHARRKEVCSWKKHWKAYAATLAATSF